MGLLEVVVEAMNLGALLGLAEGLRLPNKWGFDSWR
jgi:hypothetical protein